MTELGGGKELLGLGPGVAFVGATTIKHRSDKDTTIKTVLQRVAMGFVNESMMSLWLVTK